MTDKITLEQLKVYHRQVGDLWKAIKDGNREALFALEGIQTKLAYMCKAIRNAYGWQETELTLPWEQYLAK